MRQGQPGSKRSHSTNRDFACFYTEFKEAYHKASRAVATAWTRAGTLTEPGIPSDTAEISAIEATAPKIRRLDDQRGHAEARKRPKKMPTASFLRHPGKGAEVKKEESYKARSIHNLAQLMMNCKVSHEDDLSATDGEIMKSLARKATHVVKATEIPTLHRAITAADELRKYLASEDKPTDISSIKPLVLEQFQWESQSQVRVQSTL